MFTNAHESSATAWITQQHPSHHSAQFAGPVFYSNTLRQVNKLRGLRSINLYKFCPRQDNVCLQNHHESQFSIRLKRAGKKRLSRMHPMPDFINISEIFTETTSFQPAISWTLTSDNHPFQNHARSACAGLYAKRPGPINKPAGTAPPLATANSARAGLGSFTGSIRTRTHNPNPKRAGARTSVYPLQAMRGERKRLHSCPGIISDMHMRS